MKDYIEGLLNIAANNSYFRRVVNTGEKMQTVVMCLKPGEDIGSETHPNNEQLLICLKGAGRFFLNGDEGPFREGDAVLVPAGTEHNFINKGEVEMKIITVYSPPNHPEGVVHKTKQEAEQAEG